MTTTIQGPRDDGPSRSPSSIPSQTNTVLPSADLHVHATLKLGDADFVRQSLSELHHRGLERLLVYAHLAPLKDEMLAKRAARMPVPALNQYVGPGLDDSYDTVSALLATMPGRPVIDLIPLIGSMDDALRRRLKEVLDRGVTAVKVVHEPDLLGEDPDKLESDHAAVLSDLADRGVPAIIHVDLRASEHWLRRVLNRLPNLRLVVAHLGYSRARMATILDEFDNVMCDIANLARHMTERHDSYRRFLERYTGRVIFGSDAFLGDLSGIDVHAGAVSALGLSNDSHRALFRESWSILAGTKAPLPEPLQPPGKRLDRTATDTG